MIWDPILGCDVPAISYTDLALVTPEHRVKQSPETRRRLDQENLERALMWLQHVREQDRENERRERNAMDTEELLQLLNS